MKQGIVEPLVAYASIGKEGDGMYLVTGRTQDTSSMHVSGSLLPVDKN